MFFDIVYNGKSKWFYYKIIVFLDYGEFVAVVRNILLIEILCVSLCEGEQVQNKTEQENADNFHNINSFLIMKNVLIEFIGITVIMDILIFSVEKILSCALD